MFTSVVNGLLTEDCMILAFGVMALFLLAVIGAIEKGDYNPTINLCRAICKVLGKTLDELFGEE